MFGTHGSSFADALCNAGEDAPTAEWFMWDKWGERLNSFRRRFFAVPYCVPAWGWREHRAILRCFMTGTIFTGPEKALLRDAIREMTGDRFVIGFGSGQEAIQAALMAADVGSGHQVIMPSYCCATVAQAIRDAGAVPIFCDMDEDHNPDVNDILQLFSHSVRAVIFPHLFGTPGHIDRLEKALIDRGLRSQVLLIDDAAQSFGATLNGRLLGTFGDAGILSFGPGKTMTATGGGLLITSSPQLGEKLRQLKLFPASLSDKLKTILYWLIFRRWRRYTLPFYPVMERLLRRKHVSHGKLSGLTNLDAAIALEQLRKLNILLQTRMARKRTLDDRLLPLQEAGILSLPARDRNGRSCVATKYLIRYNKNVDAKPCQSAFRSHMSEAGIELHDLYTPIHLTVSPDSQKHPLSRTECDHAHLLQIPLEPSISETRFQCIIRSFLDFIANGKRSDCKASAHLK